LVLTVFEIQVLPYDPQALQVPADKKNPSLHPIAFPASDDEHPSALVVSAQAEQTPPLKKYPGIH